MSEYHPVRLFTIEEANQALPLVRAITNDLAQLANEVVERRQRLAMLMGNRQRESTDPYSQELASIEAEIEKDAERLRGFYQELIELGVEPKGALEGLVDFPCMMEGRIVFLCWKLGETEVSHWHEIEAGFAGRQSLGAGTLA